MLVNTFVILIYCPFIGLSKQVYSLSCDLNTYKWKQCSLMENAYHPPLMQSFQQRSHTIRSCWQHVLRMTRSSYLTQFYLIRCKTVCVRATSVLRPVSCGGHFESGLAEFWAVWAMRRVFLSTPWCLPFLSACFHKGPEAPPPTVWVRGAAAGEREAF